MENASFIYTLGELRMGDSLVECDEKLTELIQAVRKTGKSGKLTLAIAIKPMSGGDVMAVTLEDKITLTLPESTKGGTIMYATPGNSLTKQDPRQMMLDGLRVLDMPPKDLKEVG